MASSYRKPLYIEIEGVRCEVRLSYTINTGYTHDVEKELCTGIQHLIPNNLADYEVELEIFVPSLPSKITAPGLIPYNSAEPYSPYRRVMDRLLLEVGKQYGKWFLVDSRYECLFGDTLIVYFKFIASADTAWFVNSEPPQIVDTSPVIYLGSGE